MGATNRNYRFLQLEHVLLLIFFCAKARPDGWEILRVQMFLINVGGSMLGGKQRDCVLVVGVPSHLKQSDFSHAPLVFRVSYVRV